MFDLLVIGYGNSLRGDDAAGRLVAERVTALGIPGVVTRSSHQLVPELAQDMKDAANVVFVDAAANTTSLHFRAVTTVPRERALTHTCDPGGLLALAHMLHGRRPAGWLLTIPARWFEMSEEFSALARAGVDDAVALIEQWCADSIIADHVPHQWLHAAAPRGLG